jgi:dTDP-4-dehydrorhamnose 3,5-epimerase
MPAPAIQGVEVRPIDSLPDERGLWAAILRAGDAAAGRIEQVSVLTAYPGVVRAWRRHPTRWEYFAGARGVAKLVLYDDREGSPTRGAIAEFYLGPRQPQAVAVPPGVYIGLKGVGDEECLLVHAASESFDPAAPGGQRLPWDDPSVPYDWSRKDG